MLFEITEEKLSIEELTSKIPTSYRTLFFNEILTLADPSCFAGNFLSIYVMILISTL